MQTTSARTFNVLLLSAMAGVLSLLLLVGPGQAEAKTLVSEANQANRAAKATAPNPFAEHWSHSRRVAPRGRKR